jgi:CheY-like chemotaxis protein
MKMAAGETSMKKGEARRVLLVEDETVVALVEGRALRSRGYAVERAATGEEAVALFGESGDEAYDLVLMDIDLGPGIDGIEAARSILRKRAVPLVFLTSRPRDEIELRAAGIGHSGYAFKGGDGKGIIDALELAQ